ncbi:bifunctional DNA-formamidopyrimidine glycosylase/DNA-(apurinic or apyrimidinic site) lyase [Halobacillus amylolyticus]|uniref:Formamidopyrimidine-DNA glycosylase n=1 Tax=Halobacillus amylolyticus TaxID=2932259 RepID=A0ABY4HCE5_9BACI|nr:bifunctional DNA-formamidopyrimidine glycosylase/DNA-(apurinic or apyrimidinic site) lyase [Halobacillus amylolyticus]UOR12565.1 bifunctional DNA-formamidopyrimidine glycosylase/DNA-(apurinic or apyrimidinic site) lyase [Halobacillus amylolyticus]
MPELPEMETYKTLLNQKIDGHPITSILINREKSINVKPDDFINRVQNQEIKAIERRAKHLLFHLENGYVLLLHLMLGGLMFYGKEEEKPDRTVQIQLSFGDQHLYFIGLRLGYLHLLSQEEVEQELTDLGPEPLDVNFSLDTFLSLIEDRRGRIKTTLVNQEFLSGIGNCYSDEIAWHSQLLPDRKMNELNDNQKVQLYQSIRFVLQQATQYGGYMSMALFKGDTKTGSYNKKMYVYDREGEECQRCGAAIIKEELSSRKTFYCKECQT